MVFNPFTYIPPSTYETSTARVCPSDSFWSYYNTFLYFLCTVFPRINALGVHFFNPTLGASKRGGRLFEGAFIFSTLYWLYCLNISFPPSKVIIIALLCMSYSRQLLQIDAPGRLFEGRVLFQPFSRRGSKREGRLFEGRLFEAY
jgi:hypothetical protein